MSRHRGKMNSPFTGLLYRVYEKRLLNQMDASRFPRHVGVILDGHRRYARRSGLPTYVDSYLEGMRRFEDFVDWSAVLGIPSITAWVLSKENLGRPPAQLEPYYEVLVDLFGRLPRRCRQHKMGLQFIGSLDLLPASLVTAAKSAMEQTGPGAEGRNLTIAMGYGGRQEIVDACRNLVAELSLTVDNPAQMAERIDSAGLARHMYSSGNPDPDLLIRTSGESRLSGFLLWQSAYAEFVFVDVYWPAFRRVDYLRALRDFSRRDRRYGQ